MTSQQGSIDLAREARTMATGLPCWSVSHYESEVDLVHDTEQRERLEKWLGKGLTRIADSVSIGTHYLNAHRVAWLKEDR